MRVLITGGAGFIGSHLADALVDAGHSVRVLDALVPQVHGPWPLVPETPRPPAYLNPSVEFLHGDVRSYGDCRRALDGIEVVYHFAAHVGVGQSMYQPALYTDVNVHGTGVLLEEIARRGATVKKLVVASSMSVYGEAPRFASNLASKRGPRAVDEHAHLGLPNVYALTKYDQEKLCIIVGRAKGIPTTALRFFNVYGPRQALSNPYTGVIAIFASRLMNDRPPLVYDDGLQTRDFVHVSDVVAACGLALENDAIGVFNVGTGIPTSVLEVAELLADALGKPRAVEFTGTRRKGDIRHCHADIGKARRILGYKPAIGLGDGLDDLAAWLKTQTAIDRVADAARELSDRGLAV